MPYLQVNDEGSVSKVELDERAVIGRMPECTIQLHEPHASRKHAVIYSQAGQWHIRDLDTRNGTLVNGEKIKETLLKPGDVIAIGKAVLTFLGADPPDFAGSAAVESAVSPAAEVLLEDYRITEEVARSSYARICRVQKEGVDREMVAKILDRGAFQDGADRLLATVRSIAALNHPAIAAIYEVNPRGDFPYFVCEFVHGDSLAEVVATEGTLPRQRAREIIARAAEGLRAAHSRGIVHGNLKPRNILIGLTGEVKLVDFGGICPIEPPAGRTSGLAAFAGIPYYLAPEQILKNVTDHRADIYSLGAVFYSVVSGVPPFTGATDEEIMQKHLTAKPESLKLMVPDIPDAFCRTIERMLAKEPGARFQTMGDVLRALSGEEPPTAPEPEEQPRPRKTVPRKQGHSILAFLAGIILVLMLVAMFWGARELGQAVREAKDSIFGSSQEESLGD